MEKLAILGAAFKLFFDDSESEEEAYAYGSSASEDENNGDEQIPRFNSRTFMAHFRVKPDVYEVICKDLYVHMPKKYGPGRSAVQIDKQLMITLWYLGNQEGLKSVAERFNVCMTSSWRIVTHVCDALIKINGIKKFIKWPTAEAAVDTSNFNFNEFLLQDVIGYIDSTHVPIRSPIHSHNSYKNKQGKHTVLLLGVCNEKMEFLYCYTGECGSIENTSLLVRSGLENKINSGYFRITAEQHLLGGRSFPIKSWLLTPFLDNGYLSDEQKAFQMLHNKCRVLIRRAFGLLKGRFQRLFHIDCLRPAAIVKFIIAACILHNICLQNDDFAVEFMVKDNELENEDDDDDDETDIENEYIESEATIKRQRLMNSLIEYIQDTNSYD